MNEYFGLIIYFIALLSITTTCSIVSMLILLHQLKSEVKGE